ncbi:hypothetical protein [Acetobacterium sp.]|uniref:hypothetical protein n=1 Tax=Acetobacterium sp. TaxID=1872094 RepID=UPI002F40509E
MDNFEKQEAISNLLLSFYDPIVYKFFDIESDKLLDEKIEVLTRLKNGDAPIDIPNYYKVLELYPENELWD